MDRDTLRNAVLAVVGMLAVTLTAAMLPSAFQPERRGEGGPGTSGGGDGGTGGPSGIPAADPPEAVVEIPFLTELGIVLLVLTIVAVLWHLYTNRRAAFQTVALVLVFAVAVFLLSQLFTATPPDTGPPTFLPTTSDASPGDPGGETVTQPPVATVVLVLVLTAAVLGTVVAARHRSPADSTGSQDADDAGSTDVSAVGRAAGRAADRIDEGDDVDNEVYRAWREMTALLDLRRRETHTAGEFEAAAVDAGMDPEDVGELTALFEMVRYGEYEPEPTDEQRAVELLRRIERRYAEGGS